MKRNVRRLREALLDVVGLVNRPQPDAELIERAGVDLDRALFPLLARVERRGPLGINELADLCGRDHTTVSRQVTKLVSLGLVARRVNAGDARIKEVVITPEGSAMTRALDGARHELMSALLADWEEREIDELARLLRKLADDAHAMMLARKSRSP